MQQGGSGDGAKFPPVPADTYQVRVVDITEKTNQPVYQKPGETEDKLGFEFVVVEGGEYKGRKFWQDVRPIVSSGSEGFSPSTLYRIFCAVNGVKLSEDEAKSVGATDINGLVGKQVRLVVQQKPNQRGEVKNKITDFLPLKAKIDEPLFTPEDNAPPQEDSYPEIDASDIPF